MVSIILYTVFTEHMTGIGFWFHSPRYEPVLSQHFPSGASSTDVLEVGSEAEEKQKPRLDWTKVKV